MKNLSNSFCESFYIMSEAMILFHFLEGIDRGTINQFMQKFYDRIQPHGKENTCNTIIVYLRVYLTENCLEE